MPPRLGEGLQKACYRTYQAGCEDYTATIEVFVQRVVEAASQCAAKIRGAVYKAKQGRIADVEGLLEVDLGSVHCCLVPASLSHILCYNLQLHTSLVPQHRGSSRLPGSTASLVV